ncbi:DUF3037 domain-containing protein [Paenibacillus sp. 2KB_20]|uniref:DUF3037 domain-containing protein n=1 Tax=Paenibacillus sp. 2KB_20 TaxID=3232977 RepID=UPI003F9B7152
MSYLFKYSIIRYVPDEIREEFINIGMIFHSPELRYIDVKFTKNFKRVHAFDDEIDVNFFKVVLEGIKESFVKSTISGPSDEDLDDINFIEKNTFYYANQIQFSPTYLISTENYEQDLSDLFRTYVYFEGKKRSRITEDEVKILMNRILRTKDSFKNVDRNILVDIGPQEIQLDYAYKAKDRYKIIKTFSFDYTPKGSAQAPTIAKEWIYNFEKLMSRSRQRKLFGVDREDLDLITFIYTGESSNKNTTTAIKILKELTMTIEGKKQEEIISFADKISSEAESSISKESETTHS